VILYLVPEILLTVLLLLPQVNSGSIKVSGSVLAKASIGSDEITLSTIRFGQVGRQRDGSHDRNIET